MRVTAAARIRPVRCVADDSALSSVNVNNDNSPQGLTGRPMSSTGSPDQDRSTRRFHSGSFHSGSFPFRLIYRFSGFTWCDFELIFVRRVRVA